MKKFLIVGCGGSGGATLSYLMDQLQSDLALQGIDRLPAGWQFVHVDVPVGANGEAEGLGSVEALGGRYLGTGARGISYSVLDDGVSQSLLQANALDAITTWAPRDPAAVTVTISQGAGQYRAVGRMIALSKTREIRQTLEQAWSNLNRVETNAEMANLDVPGMGTFRAEESPVVLVVSSMAGGAGASMALDVARILTLLPGLQPNLLGMFMVSADIFDSLPENARSGVRSNSLAMLGEIIAAQSSASQRHDVATMTALGQQGGQGAPIPFQRVFPVGRFVGAQRTPLGDGSQQAVYRGLGRGLAALMTSGRASDQFVNYDLANTGGIAGTRTNLGWGVSWDSLQWGSFGFASLSMGRERYREYAAQRLARSSVDRLLDGHLQPGSTASAEQQVTRLLDSQWSRAAAALGLPSDEGAALTSPKMFGWFTQSAFESNDVRREARAVVDTRLLPVLPEANGAPADQWIGSVGQKLRESSSSVLGAIGDVAHKWAYRWQQDFVARLVSIVEDSVSTFGLSYTTAVLDRVEAHIGNSLIRGLHEMSIGAVPRIDVVDQAFANRVTQMRGVIVNGPEVVNEFAAGSGNLYMNHIYAQSAALGEQLLSDSIAGVLVPLRAALAEGHILLEQAREAGLDGVGLARLETDVYPAWPSDGDQTVAHRFDVADNEVLLTPSAVFPPRYEADVRAAVVADETLDFVSARSSVISQIVTGLWKTTGGNQAPGGLVTQESPWRSRTFSVNPFSNQVEVPVTARFTLHVKAAEVLTRSRQFVRRPNESFDNFCKVSLKQYVMGTDTTESETLARRQEIATKFREALTLARPLVSVDPTAVQRIHRREMVYRYKFSDVPFADSAAVTDSLVDLLVRDPDVEPTSETNLRQSLSANDAVTRIDIFGSYPNYSPLVFDSVLEPIAQDWAGLAAQGRSDWWKWRRARPLPAALPLGDAERRALVGGWFIGQIVGDIEIPGEPYTAPVRIWDPEALDWAGFPNPLLSPPSTFEASYDWLPAVLESFLLGVARAHEAPVLDSLVPYGLLRSLFDRGDEAPSTGLGERSSDRNLINWIASGHGASGRATSMAGVTPGSTPPERAAAAVAWLTRIRDLAGTQYLRAGTFGAPGGGTFSTVTSRAVASRTPLFRDVAEDVWQVTGELIEIVQRVRDQPYREVAAGTGAVVNAPVVDPATIVIPDGGTF